MTIMVTLILTMLVMTLVMKMATMMAMEDNDDEDVADDNSDDDDDDDVGGQLSNGASVYALTDHLHQKSIFDQPDPPTHHQHQSFEEIICFEIFRQTRIFLFEPRVSSKINLFRISGS